MSDDTPEIPVDAVEGEAGPSVDDAAPSTVRNFLFYTLSLPERTVRSGIGVVAGAARETASVLVPSSFQSSKTYEVMVDKSLKFLTEGIGGVEAKPGSEPEEEDFLARKAVGNFVDLAGLATLHVSPLWLFAAVSDLAYGSQTYVKELAKELQAQGLISENSRIHHMDDILQALQKSTGEAVDLVDTPPLSVEELRGSLSRTRRAIQAADYTAILPEADLKRSWDEMRVVAATEGVSLLGVSAGVTMKAMRQVETVSRGTLAGVKVAGGLLNQHVIGHYREALSEMREEGFYNSIKAVSAPYAAAVWYNYAPGSPTWTEEFVSGRFFTRMRTKISGWRAKRKAAREAETTLDQALNPEMNTEQDPLPEAESLTEENASEEWPLLPEELPKTDET